MATEMPSWLEEQALFLDNLTRPRLLPLFAPERPIILDAAEGDLIDVTQPDGQQETYRLAKRTPTADGFGVSFSMEPAEGR